MLLRCGCCGIERTSAGAQFICPVPKHGSHAFLHSLYKPCDDNDLAEMHELFGYALPKDYVSFMKLHNGAHFFVGAISIYGWGRVLSRGTSLDERAAIFLDSMHREHRLLEGVDWSQSWRPIGGLVAKNRHRLALNSSAAVRLRTASGRGRTWQSFTQMLSDCIAAANTCFDCEGIRADGYANLEEAFEGLATPRN